MNEFEKKVFDQLTKREFVVLRNGWPDFLVLNQAWDRGFALELKQGKDKLREEQKIMHKALARFGIVTLTVREDFEHVLRKKGHELLLPGDLSKLKDQLFLMKVEIDAAQRKYGEMQRLLEMATVLFE